MRGGNLLTDALNSVNPFKPADPNVTEQNNQTEKSIFSGLSERFNSKKMGGLQSTVAEGQKQIENLEKEKDEFKRQLEDNIKKCNEEQDVIKNKMDKDSDELDKLRAMLAAGSYSETENVTGERLPGGYQATDNSTDYGAGGTDYGAGGTDYGAAAGGTDYGAAAGATDYGAAAGATDYGAGATDYDNNGQRGYTENDLTEQRADQAVANLAAAPVSDSSTVSPLTAGEIGGSEGLYPGLNKQGGGRKSKRQTKRQKRLKTKRRRRRVYSRKRPKRTRGRARSPRKRGF